MGERIEAIRAILARLEAALPRTCARDADLHRRLDLLVSEGRGLLAGRPDAGLIYHLWVRVTMALHELEVKGLVQIDPPDTRSSAPSGPRF